MPPIKVRNIIYSFPVQLLLLHFKKHQLLLIYWGLLFGTVNGSFMKNFGANSLYLAPEYLDSVNAVSAAMVGMSIAVFIMSWNITTFILHSKHIKFLATTRQPFVKYCLNNFVMPVCFLLFYLFKAIDFGLHRELFSLLKVAELTGGFLSGFSFILSLSVLYFFSADRNIARRIAPVLKMNYELTPEDVHTATATAPSKLVKVNNYLTGFRKTALVRDVRHYNRDYIDTIFSRHHFSSVILIAGAFFYMIIISFFLDNPYFQFPAAASITVFFSILIAVFGALAYFLQNWSLIVTVGIFFLLNFLFKQNIIDPTNKAYGLNYEIKDRPVYNAATITGLCMPQKVKNDTDSMLAVLNRWKARQQSDRPVMFLLNVSGGGTRSATFVMNVLQSLDSISQGRMMPQTFLINGASGGMLGAAYFRELYRSKVNGQSINLQDDRYVADISKDLLNPIFSSLVARDLLSPAQKFTNGGHRYLKDRAYAFEEKLNDNTRNFFNHNLQACQADERNAKVPLIFFNSVISRDGRKMLISTQPVSYLMRPLGDSDAAIVSEPDAVDFAALFAGQQPLNLRMLTALRMNATFPYVLPNVWLPSYPVIDVMDAGLRDNYGQETTMRFMQVFEQWLKANTSKVVLINIRDRKTGNWDLPFESKSLTGSFTKPMTLLQYNWVKIQDYLQNEEWSNLKKIFGGQAERLFFQYAPANEKKSAALSFHLTNSEKIELQQNIFNPFNKKSFERVKVLLPVDN
jgi:hypothetical protein